MTIDAILGIICQTGIIRQNEMKRVYGFPNEKKWRKCVYFRLLFFRGINSLCSITRRFDAIPIDAKLSDQQAD